MVFTEIVKDNLYNLFGCSTINRHAHTEMYQCMGFCSNPLISLAGVVIDYEILMILKPHNSPFIPVSGALPLKGKKLATAHKQSLKKQ